MWFCVDRIENPVSIDCRFGNETNYEIDSRLDGFSPFSAIITLGYFNLTINGSEYFCCS